MQKQSIQYPPATAQFYTSIKANGRLLDDVCAMRYDVYLANKSINANDTKRFFDQFDQLPNSQSFLTYCNGNVVGSIRACVYTPGTDSRVPALEVYESEIALELGLEQTFVESNMSVMAPSFQRLDGNLARSALLRNMLNSAIINKSRTVIAAVRPEHVSLYKSFSFAPISSAKLYPHFNGERVLLACQELTALSAIITRKLKR